jgi:hypothetical protein
MLLVGEEEEEFIRIVHAPGATPKEMGPTRHKGGCGARDVAVGEIYLLARAHDGGEALVYIQFVQQVDQETSHGRAVSGD